MSESDTGGDLGGFDRRLRDWGQRAPATDPASASRRVLASLPAGAPSHLVLRLATVAALVVTITLAVFLGAPRTTPQLPRTALADAPAHLDERVMQFWIDPQTPVYFVLSPLGSTTGGVS
jgi:hypothetical protein